MKISIITINYNNQIGLKDTLDSIYHQTNQNFEHIIVDGASTDNSLDIIKSYSKKYNIILISEPDDGIYNAMNKGIKIATGDYLLFLNSGDYLYNNIAIDTVIEHINHEDIACFNAYFENNERIRELHTYSNKISFLSFYKKSLCHQSLFYKKSLFEKYGGYNEKNKICSDWEFNVRRIVFDQCSFIAHQAITSVYNYDGLSSTDEGKEKAKKEHQKIYDELLPPKVLEDYQKLYEYENNSLIQVLLRVHRKWQRRLVNYFIKGLLYLKK